MSATAQAIVSDLLTVPIKRDGQIENIKIAGCSSLDDLRNFEGGEEEFFLESNFDLGKKDTCH